MTPAQKQAARAAIAARLDTLEASRPIPPQAGLARFWLTRPDDLDAWWGAAAMLVRGERAAATRVKRVGIITDIEETLEQVRAAVGAAADDEDLRNPNTRPPAGPGRVR